MNNRKVKLVIILLSILSLLLLGYIAYRISQENIKVTTKTLASNPSLYFSWDVETEGIAEPSGTVRETKLCPTGRGAVLMTAEYRWYTLKGEDGVKFLVVDAINDCGLPTANEIPTGIPIRVQGQVWNGEPPYIRVFTTEIIK